MGKTSDFLEDLDNLKDQENRLSERAKKLREFLWRKIPTRPSTLRTYVRLREDYLFANLFTEGQIIEIITHDIMEKCGFRSLTEVEEAFEKLKKAWEGEIEIYISRRPRICGWRPIISFLVADEEDY